MLRQLLTQRIGVIICWSFETDLRVILVDFIDVSVLCIATGSDRRDIVISQRMTIEYGRENVMKFGCKEIGSGELNRRCRTDNNYNTIQFCRVPISD